MQKKANKLQEFILNSISYMTIVNFQVKIDRLVDSTETNRHNSSCLRNEIKELLDQFLGPRQGSQMNDIKISQIKLLYHSLRDNNQFLAYQILLLKRFIQQSLSELEGLQEENVEADILKESYSELMAANKDLIELHDEMEQFQSIKSSNNDVLTLQELADLREIHSGDGMQQLKLGLMQQLVRLAERAHFAINLDYLRWLISYGWNLGIQKYRQGCVGIREESRIYIQFCYTLVE